MKRFRALFFLLPGLSGAGLTAAESADTPPALSLAELHQALLDRGQALHHWLGEHATLLLGSLAGLLISYLIARLLARGFSRLINRFLHKEDAASLHEEIMEAIRKPLIRLFFLGGALLSLQDLARTISSGTAWLLFKLGGTAATLLTVWLVFRLLGVASGRIADRTAGDRSMNLLLAGLLSKIAKTVILLLAFFFIGQNIFGINISALLAGAGVAGLAVALAAQDTLANFFGSIMILIDKPFTVGEFVRFGAVTGTVENVGFRSTRIRAVDGNLFQVPNRQITDSTLENISRRPDIRYVFEIGLVYQTSPEQMETAIRLLREIITAHPGIDADKRPPLINFTDFKDWSLNITVVCWFNTREFARAQSWKSELNLTVLRRFNEAGLSFAYPTATRFVAAAGPIPAAVSGDGRPSAAPRAQDITNPQ